MNGQWMDIQIDGDGWGLVGGGVDRWVHETVEGLMNECIDKFALEWMNGGGMTGGQGRQDDEWASR